MCGASLLASVHIQKNQGFTPSGPLFKCPHGVEVGCREAESEVGYLFLGPDGPVASLRKELSLPINNDSFFGKKDVTSQSKIVECYEKSFVDGRDRRPSCFG